MANGGDRGRAGGERGGLQAGGWAGAAASPLGTPEATSDHTGPLPTVVLTDWAPGTPIAMQPGKEIRVPTMMPWPTSTPRPTPTRRPGPTATAFLLHKPASDASGTILFNSSDPEISRQSIMAIPVDGRGQKAAEPALMSLSIDFFPVLDFPSPDGHYLLMHRPVEPEGQPFVFDWESRQVWPLLKSHPIQEHLIGRLYGWHPDSRQVLFWFFN